MTESFALTGAIDLGNLPPPDIVPQPDFEQTLAERKAKLISLCPVEKQEEIRRTLDLESEPLLKQLQESAYRELLIRQNSNDQARGLLLQFARGPQLNHIGVTYHGLERLAGEGDDAYRVRIALAPEGKTTAGTAGKYELVARSAHPDVKSVRLDSPQPLDAHVYVLSRQGDGTPSAEVLAAVLTALNGRTVRDLGDWVQVFPAQILPYTITAELFLYKEPGGDITLAKSQADLRAYVAKCHRLKGSVVRSGIDAALTNAGVHEVRLTGWADVQAGMNQAPYCTAISLTIGGYVDA
ncbi:MAG: baseplate J/gp47 family protein [Gammaproteobacteria bacterium]|nr:baseplate J/gp47 family protein [Gammaproteobacteria bacterium]